ncbi:extracellular triacylglycerol lipase precursor [Moniliophthora roreri MCA 2997]|uniref:Carboxylic ester hydrolase n=1 Tax=Moniliophthora roreri (strain MCA 2997) TaxID=1381753 RepID=V2YDV9_MONRO|nr:extracellular triacylglycerol lipase precursor [Moniliophthora roreri MCA 2997]
MVIRMSALTWSDPAAIRSSEQAFKYFVLQYELIMFFLLFQVISSFLLNTLASDAYPQVQLGSTSITGTARNGVEFFGGIPYAEPPIANLRLRPAVLKGSDTWNATSFDASEFGKACLQPSLPRNNVSEDCLTINIFRPLTTSPYKSTKLPCLLWIHGGGFVAGSGSRPGYDGSSLVRRGLERGTPIIVMTINYRLGPLGFPQGLEAASLGREVLNLGLRDSLVALQWVKNNIDAFGGDPQKVTVFGESAGARAIELYILNGGLGGLARGAIMESSGGLPIHPASTRDPVWRTYVSAVGPCSFAVESKNTIECLRNKATSDDLFDAIAKAGIVPTSFDWLPVLDGPKGMLPDYASRLDVKVKIPVIYGDNLDEGTLLAPQNITGPDDTRQGLFDIFTPSPAGDKALRHAIAELMNIYPDDPRFGSPFGTGNQTFGLNPEYKHYAALVGDLTVHAERRLFARKMNEASAPMYGYLFSDPDAIKVMPSEFRPPNAAPGSLGVPHTSEILYVFGNFAVENNMMPASAKELSTMMMDYWIAFANGMNPNDGKGIKRPEWGLYKTSRPRMMQLKGGDTKMIGDFARENGIAYMNRHAVLFDQ